MTNEVEEIRISIEEAKEVIKTKEDTIRLVESELFRKIVGKRYFEEESARLVGLLSDDNIDDKALAGVHRQMFGISNFQRFLRELIQKGEMMEQGLEDAQEELDGMEVN